MNQAKKKPTMNQLERFLADIELIPVKSIELSSVKHIDELSDVPLTLQKPDMIGFNDFVNRLSSFQVHYAIGSNSTQLVSADNFKNFVEISMQINSKKYVFHNVTKDAELIKLMPDLIPIPKFLPVQEMNELRICRLYAGAKHSGTNLHQHSAALNFLVSGKKLWMTFPTSEKNNAFVIKNKMQYGYVNDLALNWLYDNYELLIAKDSIDGLNFFIQNSGDVAYVPNGHYHAIINLEDSVGITYSWN